MEGKTVYFDRPGSDNTDEVLRIAKARADERGIKTVLVASTRGDTALRAADICKGMKIIAVGHSTGFSQPDQQKLTEEARKQAESLGVTVLTTTHVFAGVSRAMLKKFNTMCIGDIIANVLRVFGEGMKVCCEIAMMAADAGLVRTDEEVICIAGTGRGADTAIVLNPVNSQVFFDMKVKEILCKPRF